MTTSVSTNSRLGDILIRSGYVTSAEIDDAVAQGRDSGRPLGEVLLESGSLTEAQLRDALTEQRVLRQAVLDQVRAIPRIGTLLERRGLLRERDLAAALDEQVTSWESLGTILVRRGKLTAEDLADALGIQRRLQERVLDALSSVPRLGQLIERQGLVDGAQLKAALVVQKSSGERLGDILVGSGLVAVSDLSHLLAEQHRLRNAALSSCLGLALVTAQADLAGADDTTVQLSLELSEHAESDAALYDRGAVEAVVPLLASPGPGEGVAIAATGGPGDGRLLCRAADGPEIPYRVVLRDPLSTRSVAVPADGSEVTFESWDEVPVLVEIAFDHVDGLPAGTFLDTLGLSIRRLS